nr:MAG TPA: hypothetical protein [Inoviridae sp.]
MNLRQIGSLVLISISPCQFQSTIAFQGASLISKSLLSAGSSSNHL